MRVVERRDENSALGLGDFRGAFLGLVEVVAEKEDLAAEVPDRIDLDLRGHRRHNDECRHIHDAAG